MKLKPTLIFIFTVIVSACYSQDTIVNTISKKDIKPDSSLDVVGEITPAIDSTRIKSLEDIEELSKIDLKWREELYSNTLFDSIYESVSSLDYNEVDYNINLPVSKTSNTR